MPKIDPKSSPPKEKYSDASLQLPASTVSRSEPQTVAVTQQTSTSANPNQDTPAGPLDFAPVLLQLTSKMEQLGESIVSLQNTVVELQASNTMLNRRLDQQTQISATTSPHEHMKQGVDGRLSTLPLPNQQAHLEADEPPLALSPRSRLKRENEIVGLVRRNIGGSWLYSNIKPKEAMEFFINLEREFSRIPDLSDRLKIEVIRRSTRADAQHLIASSDEATYAQVKHKLLSFLAPPSSLGELRREWTNLTKSSSETNAQFVKRLYSYTPILLQKATAEELDTQIINQFYRKSSIDIQAAFDDAGQNVKTTSDLIAFCDDLESYVVTQSNLIAARIRDRNVALVNETQASPDDCGPTNPQTFDDFQPDIPFNPYEDPSWCGQQVPPTQTTGPQQSSSFEPQQQQQPQFGNRNNLYCGFHCCFGHSTGRCIKLRNFIAQNPNEDISVYYQNTPENSYQPVGQTFNSTRWREN